MQVPTNFSPKDVVLTPLDGVSTMAAHKLREALRDYVQLVGKTSLASTLLALSTANGNPSATQAVVTNGLVFDGVTGSGTSATITVADGEITAIALSTEE